MQRILITGATGALGQAVIHQLKHIKQTKIFITSSKDQLPNDQYTSIKCDLKNLAQITNAFNISNPDLILHLAALFTHDMHEAYKLNVVPAAHLLELTLTRKKTTRIVLVGSAAEYGFIKERDNPVTENNVLAPISPYGISKAWQSQLLGWYSSCQVDVLCARIFNLYGPGISEKLFAGRLQHQISELKLGLKSIIEVGSLAAIRDYVTTNDAASQILAIARNGKSGNIYHVASGVPIRMRDFLYSQLAINNIERSSVRESEEYSNRPGLDIPIIYASMEKTRALMEY